MPSYVKLSIWLVRIRSAVHDVVGEAKVKMD